MGYAIVLPYSLLKIASSQPAGSSVELTTAQTNFSIASFTTPAYSGNPALAFVDIIVPSRQNWDATQSNFFDATNLGYIGIDSGGGTKDCGKIPQYAFHTPANTWPGMATPPDAGAGAENNLPMVAHNPFDDVEAGGVAVGVFQLALVAALPPAAAVAMSAFCCATAKACFAAKTGSLGV